MTTKYKGFIVPLTLILVFIALVAGGIFLFFRSDIATVTPITPATSTPATTTTPDTSGPVEQGVPVITSINPSSGSVGTVVELRGANFSGFEGDHDALIENTKGETAYLPGLPNSPRDGKTIRVRIDSQLCTTNNSYSGNPCAKYLTITPGVYKISTMPWGAASNKVNFTVTASAVSTMPLTVFVQDKEAARTRDCGITYPVVQQIPKTTAVADASLKILFGGELKAYGVYKSVTIENGVAKVMLASENMADGYPLGSAASCQIGHIQSVLKDTLTQYPTIRSVELYSPRGRINF